MSLVFQNLAGLQNRYPYNQWQELLGNCDVQLFLGCTDALTAEFISERSGVASVAVSSQAKQLGTWRISDYTPEYRETNGVGKRNLLTPDEVLRLPLEKALIIIRGHKLLQVDKYDYSLHPEAKLLRSCKASTHVPNWRLEQESSPPPTAAPPPKSMKPKERKEKPPTQAAPKKGAVTKTDKSSIMD